MAFFPKSMVWGEEVIFTAAGRCGAPAPQRNDL